MLGMINIGRSGLRVYGGQIDAIANNIANVNSTGYIRKNCVFAALVTGDLRHSRVPARNDVPGGQGAAMVERHDFTPGRLEFTGNSLDLAIDGEGFFALVREGETVYSRSGIFTTDGQGNLVHFSGALLPGITLPSAASLEVNPDGLTWLVEGDQRQPGPQLELYRFENPHGLKHVGAGLFLPTAVSGVPQPDAVSQIAQGYRTANSVDLNEEMTRLLMAQRAFQVNSRSVSAADDMWDLVNQLRR